MDIFLLSLAILSLAFLLDKILGEPPPPLHLTVWMGKIAEFMTGRIKSGRPISEKLQGSILTISVISIFVIPSYYLLIFSRTYLGLVPFLLISIFLFKTCFAVKAMEKFTLPIAEAAQREDYASARRFLKKVVRRNPNKLTEQQVLSATVETIAEGTVDGATGSIFLYSLFGVPGALAYRAINTLDSTVGYKDRKHLHIGWFAAKLDTVVNYLPARLTAILTILSARIVDADWKNSMKMLRRDHGKTESTNAGWPMSAMAGALGVMLEKPGNYSLGQSSRELNPDDIRTALKIMKFNVLFFVLIVAVPLIAVSSWLIPHI
ncbi:MAG: cobalamin biosynthesis protein [Nitrosopumilus sp.]